MSKIFIGSKIKHYHFGTGIVTNIRPHGWILTDAYGNSEMVEDPGDVVISVDFESVGSRELLKNYADLEVIYANA